MMDAHDFWLEQVLNECQNTLVHLQNKYGTKEISVDNITPEDLVAINIASGFVTLYRLAADNNLIQHQQELSREAIVVH